MRTRSNPIASPMPKPQANQPREPQSPSTEPTREPTNLAGRSTLSDIPSASEAEDSENSGSPKRHGDSDGSLTHDHPTQGIGAEKGNQQPLEPGNTTWSSDEELAEAIKTRQKLEHQVMLAKERQRISRLQHTLTHLNQAAPRESSSTTLGTTHALSTPETPVMDLRTPQVEVPIVQPQGQKRPRADTVVELASPTTNTTQLPIHAAKQAGPTAPVASTGQGANLVGQCNNDDGKPPPKLTEIERFHRKSMREYILWDYRIRNKFACYARWFASEARKIQHGVDCISNDLLWKWLDHEKQTTRPQTWQDFTEFLLNQIDNTDNLEQEAHQKYTDARQREGQTVRDFATYLGTWEAMFSHRLTPALKIEGLRTRVLEEVRREAKRYPNPPKDYDDFVTYLQMVENGMKERRDTIN